MHGMLNRARDANLFKLARSTCRIRRTDYPPTAPPHTRRSCAGANHANTLAPPVRAGAIPTAKYNRPSSFFFHFLFSSSSAGLVRRKFIPPPLCPLSLPHPHSPQASYYSPGSTWLVQYPDLDTNLTCQIPRLLFTFQVNLYITHPLQRSCASCLACVPGTSSFVNFRQHTPFSPSLVGV